MGIPVEPPSRESYNHVMMRSDKDASVDNGQSIRFVCYHENVRSRSIEWGGQRVHMLFIRTKTTAHRAWRLGWTNITEDWLQYLEATTPKPTTDAQQKILEALTGDWLSKKQIIVSSGVPDTEWRTAIKYLIEKGLAETNGGKGKSTNRRYFYRRAGG